MIRCRKCGRLCADCLIGSCQHPSVNTVFGKQICMYCCKGCKFHIQLNIRDHGVCGVKCRYHEEGSF